MDERLNVIGADAGNGYIKLDLGFDKFQYPSLVSKGKDRQLAKLMENFDTNNPVEEQVKQQLNVLDVLIRDQKTGIEEHFYCGSLAAREGIPLTQWDDDKGANNASRALLLAGIAAGIPENKAIVYLSASLPVKNYKRFKDSYENHMVGTFTVEFLSGPLEGISKTIKIIRCRVYPEGMGVFIREIQDRKQNHLMQGIQALIAPGFRTTEFILFRDGKPIDELSGSLELGIASAHKRVANLLSDDYGLDYSEHEIDQMFLQNSRKAIRGNETIKIKALCSQEFPTLAEQILSKLRVKWQDVWPKIENFLVTDGGGKAIYNDLNKLVAEWLGTPCLLVDNPEFATAAGNRVAALVALSGGKSKALLAVSGGKSNGQ